MNISEHKKIFGISAVIGLVVIFSAYLMNNAVANQLTTIEPTNQLAVYVPLSGSELFPSAEPEIGTFLQTAFEWGIVIVLVLAVLYILMGGIEYMTSDAVFDKDDGKKKITAALAGLILALASWLILKTINPELLNTDPTRNADSIQRDTESTEDSTPQGTVFDLTDPVSNPDTTYVPSSVLSNTNPNVISNPEAASAPATVSNPNDASDVQNALHPRPASSGNAGIDVFMSIGQT